MADAVTKLRGVRNAHALRRKLWIFSVKWVETADINVGDWQKAIEKRANYYIEMWAYLFENISEWQRWVSEWTVDYSRQQAGRTV